jgi:hypothetical protein
MMDRVVWQLLLRGLVALMGINQGLNLDPIVPERLVLVRVLDDPIPAHLV